MYFLQCILYSEHRRQRCFLPRGHSEPHFYEPPDDDEEKGSPSKEKRKEEMREFRQWLRNRQAEGER